MTEQASRDWNKDMELFKEANVNIIGIMRFIQAQRLEGSELQKIRVEPASEKERADKAERALREQTEETARWICKYHGDANRFQRMKGELAAAKGREEELKKTSANYSFGTDYRFPNS
ncbi:hypothetical protein [Paenibacillus fonticola]|uniref:hypothetical protein n=1 Tax=Paenibacillus fonticola TaxID=379896 RepID=UPI00036151F9|nr:hypothetical protein [Paenibacillus fonticola]